MKNRFSTLRTLRRTTGLVVIALAALAPAARAHCDTLAGPVVADARAALEQGEITPVLKWIRPEAEAEVRARFAEARTVRALGAEARTLADRSFFETVVRLHRAGEGAPFTGLVDAPPEPIIQAADRALAEGSDEPLVDQLAAAMAEGVQARFENARITRSRAGESVTAGRDYVAAYVEWTHYIERLYADAASAASEHLAAPETVHHH